MARLNRLEELLCNNVITKNEQISLKGKGLGNMHRMNEKNCPPPVEDGKIKNKHTAVL